MKNKQHSVNNSKKAIKVSSSSTSSGRSKGSKSNRNSNKYDSILSVLDDVDQLVVPSTDTTTIYKNTITNIFDIAIQNSTKQYGPLKTLVDVSSSSPSSSSLDIESIWEQLQLRNKPVLRNIKKRSIQLLNQYQQ